jgi:hypothetical protein
MILFGVPALAGLYVGNKPPGGATPNEIFPTERREAAKAAKDLPVVFFREFRVFSWLSAEIATKHR